MAEHVYDSFSPRVSTEIFINSLCSLNDERLQPMIDRLVNTYYRNGVYLGVFGRVFGHHLETANDIDSVIEDFVNRVGYIDPQLIKTFAELDRDTQEKIIRRFFNQCVAEIKRRLDELPDDVIYRFVADWDEYKKIMNEKGLVAV